MAVRSRPDRPRRQFQNRECAEETVAAEFPLPAGTLPRRTFARTFVLVQPSVLECIADRILPAGSVVHSAFSNQVISFLCWPEPQLSGDSLAREQYDRHIRRVFVHGVKGSEPSAVGQRKVQSMLKVKLLTLNRRRATRTCVNLNGLFRSRLPAESFITHTSSPESSSTSRIWTCPSVGGGAVLSHSSSLDPPRSSPGRNCTRNVY